MKFRKLAIISCFSIFVTGTIAAQDMPKFFKDILPEHAAVDMLKGYGTLQGEEAALDEKTRELIGLAVAAQIPCEYCVYSHMAKLKKLGASSAEIREAVANAAYIRMWSTMLYGGDYDLDEFKAEFDQLLGGA